MVGDVRCLLPLGVKGVGDFFGKAVSGKATGESAINQNIRGTVSWCFEPTYKHLLFGGLGRLERLCCVG